MGLGAGAESERSSPPDHQISCFAPERIYVVRHPCARWDPLRSDSYGGPDRRRPMDRARSTSPKTGDYGDWDAWLTRFPTPDPGRPVPTPDPKVTFGASPVKCGAAKAADGRHP